MHMKEELETRFRCVTSIGAAVPRYQRAVAQLRSVHITFHAYKNIRRIRCLSDVLVRTTTGLWSVACKLTPMLPLWCKSNAEQDHREPLLSKGGAHVGLAAMDPNKDPDLAFFLFRTIEYCKCEGPLWRPDEHGWEARR